jgi:hypothetical protein
MKYKATYEIFYNTSPQSPKRGQRQFEADSDKGAENKIRDWLTFTIEKNQSARLLTLTNLSK